MNEKIIKPINIIKNELLENLDEYDRNIHLINTEISNAILCKRSSFTTQLVFNIKDNIELVLGEYKKQEGVNVDIINFNDIITVTRNIYIVDVKISW